ncbi:MAG: thioredoxin [Nitrosopumilus sp. B06]|nr:MAG: thioredoxin [Nitrosopumilus sp. B06]
MLDQQNRPKPQPVTVLNMGNFDGIISADSYTLVDFWAEWCGPCKMMHPIFESLSKKYPHIRFARLDVDSSQGVASRYSVSSIPTFIMFRNGKVLDRMSGAVGAPGIHMICQKHQ